jgi:hypothetical protein
MTRKLHYERLEDRSGAEGELIQSEKPYPFTLPETKIGKMREFIRILSTELMRALRLKD